MTSKFEVCGNLPEIVNNDLSLYEGDLRHYFKKLFFLAHNAANAYHNFHHISHSLWLCYQACLFYRELLSKKEMRNLLIAAIFHDFNHTGYPVLDSGNIHHALLAVDAHLHQDDKPHKIEIVGMITKTEYPKALLFTEEQLNLSEQILLDADQLHIFSPDWIQQMIFGVSTEWKKGVLDIMKSQITLVENLKLRSEWAKSTFNSEIMERKKKEIREILAILEIEN